MGGHVDGRHGAAPAVAQRRRDGAHAVLELLVDEREALAAHLGQLVAQLADVGDRALGAGLWLHPVEEGAELARREVGQQHPTHRGGDGGQARAERERDGHDPLGRHPGHVDDLVAVEHGHRDRLVHLLGERLHRRLGDLADAERRQVGVAEVEHLRRELELAPVGAHVAERREGEQQPASGRPRQAGAARHVGQRERGVVLGEGPQHGQPALEGLHEVAVARRAVHVRGCRRSA